VDSGSFTPSTVSVSVTSAQYEFDRGGGVAAEADRASVSAIVDFIVSCLVVYSCVLFWILKRSHKIEDQVNFHDARQWWIIRGSAHNRLFTSHLLFTKMSHFVSYIQYELNFFKKAWIWKFLPILNTRIEYQKQILWISLFFTSIPLWKPCLRLPGFATPFCRNILHVCPISLVLVGHFPICI
jgi:hypothetical protein